MFLLHSSVSLIVMFGFFWPTLFSIPNYRPAKETFTIDLQDEIFQQCPSQSFKALDLRGFNLRRDDLLGWWTQDRVCITKLNPQQQIRQGRAELKCVR